MMRLLAIVALFGLGGCAGVPVSCPALAQYSQLEQSVLAGELPNDGQETQVQIEDYVKLRQACRGGK